MTPSADLYSRPEIFVGGRWLPSADGTEHKVVNPASGEVLGTTVLAGVADVDAAVAAARASFDAGVWADRSPSERATVLRAAADYLEDLGDAAVDLLTRELGCPRWFAQRAHVPNPIRHLRYYAGLIEAEQTDEPRTDGTNHSLVVREPVGVVGAITPWNGPLSTPALKAAPALAAGCSFVLKPPPETPLTAYLLADALVAAGLPEGVLSIVPADREVGEHLVRHRDVDKIAFTGGTAAGRRIMALCAERIARVTLELGGKSAAIMLDDADVEHFVRSLVPMAMMVNGQACIAQTRVLVPRARHTEVGDALAAAFAALPVGDPFDPQTQIGPLVSERQRQPAGGGGHGTGRAGQLIRPLSRGQVLQSEGADGSPTCRLGAPCDVNAATPASDRRIRRDAIRCPRLREHEHGRRRALGLHSQAHALSLFPEQRRDPPVNPRGNSSSCSPINTCSGSAAARNRKNWCLAP